MNKLPNLEAHKVNYEQGKSIASFIKILSNWPCWHKMTKSYLESNYFSRLEPVGLKAEAEWSKAGIAVRTKKKA